VAAGSPTQGSGPSELTRLGTRLYFTADDGTSGSELWRTDGTRKGTTRVKDINPGEDDSDPTDFVRLGDRLYFRADDGTTGFELWRSDGTPRGTRLVKDINQQPPSP
jgi:ELWxxDGT repeat protein